MLKRAFNDDDMTAALKAAANCGDGISAITAIVPQIVGAGNAAAAATLATAPSRNRAAWLPEAMALFMTPGLSAAQRRAMLAALHGAEDIAALAGDDAGKLAACHARIGGIGFSFPLWRFVSMGFDGASLLERYGMKRLTRASDVRDESLPRSNPERDRLGPGFVWHDREWSVEYRRAYIAITRRSDTAPVTLVVRNSSHFFGRDRLPAPAFAAFAALSPASFEALDEAALAAPPLRRWEDAMQDEAVISAAGKIRRVDAALTYLGDFDARLAKWLASADPLPAGTNAQGDAAGPEHAEGGAGHLAAFLRHMIARHATGGKPSAPLYLGIIDPAMPPWFPAQVTPVTTTLADAVERGADLGGLNAGGKLALLSGPDGDLPAMPVNKAAAATSAPLPTPDVR